MQKQIHSRKGRIKSVISGLTALLLVSTVSYLGVSTYQAGHAAAGASLYLTPANATAAAGTNVSVTLRENSGSDAVNSVQASINYDSNQLQYVSVSEGGSFTTVAANSVGTPGVVRIGRGTEKDSPQTGDKAVVTITFKVIGSSGSADLTIDKNYSLLVRSADSADILQAVGSASYMISGGTASGSTASDDVGASTVSNSASKPVLYLTPSSGAVAAGTTLSTQVRINAFSTAVTTVEAVVNYPADALQYVSAEDGSTFGTKQRTKGGDGTVDIIRGVPGGSNGVSGDNAVITLNFKVLAGSGSAPLTLSKNSSVFDKSGSGTNILDYAASAGAKFTLAAAGTQTPPLQIATQNGGDPAAKPVIITQSQALKVVSSKNGTAALSKDDDGNEVTELSGQVELSPVSTTNDSNSPVNKVEYFLGTKLFSTQKSSPYTFKFDTLVMKNGTYTVTIKTYFADGTVDSRSDKMLVSNKFTLAYVIRHYWLGFIIGLVVVVGIAILLWKVILPKLDARNQARQAAGTDHDTFFGAGVTNGPIAAEPTVVAPLSSTPEAVIPPADVQVSALPMQAPVQMFQPQPPATTTPVTAPTAEPPMPAQPISQPPQVAAPPQPVIESSTLPSPATAPQQISSTQARSMHAGPMPSARPMPNYGVLAATPASPTSSGSTIVQPSQPATAPQTPELPPSTPTS